MRNKISIVTEIKANWAAICEKAGVADNPPKLPAGDVNLLGTGTKTEKPFSDDDSDGNSEEIQYVTAIIYMAPAWSLWGSPEKAAGRTLCPFATGTGARTVELADSGRLGCIDFCLALKAGRMPQRGQGNARRWKAALFVGARQLFGELLRFEAASFGRSVARKADSEGIELRPVIRVDGGTDTGYGRTMAAEFPEIQWYDYTKVPARMRAAVAGKLPVNYHVTFSYSGPNRIETAEALRGGVNVAAVIPEFGTAGRIEFDGESFEAFEADSHDMRFRNGPAADGRGRFGTLRFKALKGRAEALASAEAFLLGADTAGR